MEPHYTVLPGCGNGLRGFGAAQNEPRVWPRRRRRRGGVFEAGVSRGLGSQPVGEPGARPRRRSGGGISAWFAGRPGGRVRVPDPAPESGAFRIAPRVFLCLTCRGLVCYLSVDFQAVLWTNGLFGDMTEAWPRGRRCCGECLGCPSCRECYIFLRVQQHPAKRQWRFAWRGCGVARLSRWIQ